MTLFLVRHAVAGVRDNTDPNDVERPLDRLGLDQAAHLVERLGHVEIDEIRSSAARRCRETVEPLADHLGLPVEIDPALFEGSSTSATMDLIRSFTGRTVVLCSHGDVIPDALRSLTVGGTRLDGSGCAKGSVWKLDNSTERIESGEYLGVVPAQPAR